MELKQKGQKADIGAFKQIRVSLIWTSPVDLDLMAFYKTKDGRIGGVYSDNYAGGSLGNVNKFPFIELSGDEGVGASGGDNSEEMRIMKLDDYESLYICALNFTDASSGSSHVFADYDARVEVVTDHGEKHTVALDSRSPGPVAVLCRFEAGMITNSLINDSEVLMLDEFRSKIPGADKLKLASKVTLKAKGDSFDIKQKGAASGECLVNLNWNTQPAGAKSGFFSKLLGSGSQGVDLDLGCLFELNNGTKGAIQALGDALGNFNTPPYILHCGDDRTGASAEGENMRINLSHSSQFRRILFYAFIYEGVPNWAATDAVITLKIPGQPSIEARMEGETASKGFCAIAMLEFAGTAIKATKLVSFHNGHEDCDRQYNWGLRWVAGSK